MTRDKTAADALWRFSLMVYSRPGVAEALIRLQDRGAHNVNLLLFGLWLAARGTRLDAAGLARARAAIAGLDAGLVAPLRRLRRELRSDPDADVQALRRRLLTLEIAAERRVQARLAGSVGDIRGAHESDRTAIAIANCALILGDEDAAGEEARLVLQLFDDIAGRGRGSADDDSRSSRGATAWHHG